MGIVIDDARSCTNLHGFVDVLGSRHEWPAADHSLPGSYLTGRQRLALPNGPVTVESVTLASGRSGEAVLPGDEFVLVVSGTVRFSQKGRDFEIGSGEAAVFLRDHPLAWSANEPAELIVMRCTADRSGEEPVKIDTSATLSPSSPPLADVLLGPTPTCRSHSDYRSASGEFACGTWDSTPYRRRLMTFRHFELMQILEGDVTFADQHGRTGSFGKGDIILFVQNGSASWESHAHVKKIFSTYRPAQQA